MPNPPAPPASPPPRVLAVIPARFASTRFPGKPLASETGKPLIQHVVEQVAEARSVARVVVATDDGRIADAVKASGAEAVMTGEHPNGTSRIAEAVERLEAGGAEAFDIVLNVQGDEPEVPGATIDALVAGLSARPDADMATLASPFEPGEDPTNPNVVKLVADRRGFALYFSRSLIPFDRDAERLGRRPGLTDPAAAAAFRGAGWTLPGPGPFKHPGLYAYRRAFLSTYTTLAPAPLEEAEKLEQLRVLEHGFRIAVVLADAPHPGIDTPEQYADFVQRWKARSA